MDGLRVGTGTSELDDARAAGRAAATAARQRHGDESPLLVLVYASVRYDLTELLAGVRSVTGTAALAGCTSCGHFVDDTVTEPGRGVAVMVLGGGPYRFGVASSTGLSAAPEAVGAAVTRAARQAAGAPDGDPERPHAAMLLFSDGIGGDQQAVITGVHRVCGAPVPVVGGAASDDRKMTHTSVFHDDQVLDGGVVGVWISSPRPLAVSSAHGWTAMSLPVLITRSEGVLVHEIEGRPASEVFTELALGIGAQQPLSRTGSTWESSYALGLIQPDGSHLVRGVFTTAEGPIRTFTPLPAYSAVQVMTADPGTLLSVVEGVVEDCLIHGDESVLLAFNCVGRMDIFGAAYPDEIARMAKAARGVRCFGSYTYGEFARLRGVGGVHNATLTTLAL